MEGDVDPCVKWESRGRCGGSEDGFYFRNRALVFSIRDGGGHFAQRDFVIEVYPGGAPAVFRGYRHGDRLLD